MVQIRLLMVKKHVEATLEKICAQHKNACKGLRGL